MSSHAAYRGRFAPTPSGPLHLGSLYTALVSYLAARAAGGQWLLRIDDLDGPRCEPGAAEQILQQLAAHGLQADEPPRWQSAHLAEYQQALSALQRQRLIYACRCSRRQLRAQASAADGSAIYPGSCRELGLADRDTALRIKLPARKVRLDDDWQGLVQRDLQSELGDFVVRRRDGMIAYQLACVVDEQAQGISHVVRGADLPDSSICQTQIAQYLGFPEIRFGHLPVLLDAEGAKLSKQHHAPPLDSAHAADNLRRCLELLRQATPPPTLKRPARIMEFALGNWRPQAIAGTGIRI